MDYYKINNLNLVRMSHLVRVTQLARDVTSCPSDTALPRDTALPLDTTLPFDTTLRLAQKFEFPTKNCNEHRYLTLAFHKISAQNRVAAFIAASKGLYSFFLDLT